MPLNVYRRSAQSCAPCHARRGRVLQDGNGARRRAHIVACAMANRGCSTHRRRQVSPGSIAGSRDIIATPATDTRAGAGPATGSQPSSRGRGGLRSPGRTEEQAAGGGEDGR